jgi:DNA-binding transcriptional ArsR family regulator
MTTLHLTPDDLTKLRFAYRPLIEIPLSYRVLINPDYQSPHRRWVEEAHQALYGVELPYLEAMVSPRGYIPDFLCPTPLANSVDIEDDFEQVLATPDETIRKYVRRLINDIGESAIRLLFFTSPRDAMQRLVEDMRLYWQRTLEHSWSRMVNVLEGDILYRGRTLALDGPHSLLHDLHPSISYQPGEIQLGPVPSHACCCPAEANLCGDGIQLVPTIFDVAGRMSKITPEWRPMIGYSARGVGLYNHQPRASRPLEVALGAGRARVLQGLRSPATTGDIARRLGLTSGAVSQHLDRLRRAGLVEPHRSGKWVYYQLTRRGEELVALFERIT